MDRTYMDFIEQMRAEATHIAPDEHDRIAWDNGVVSMVFAVGETAPVLLVGLSGRGMAMARADCPAQPDAQPIIELRSSRDGGADNRLKLAVSSCGLRLRFKQAFLQMPDTTVTIDGKKQTLGKHRLVIKQVDEQTGLAALSVFEAYPRLSAVRCQVMLSCAQPLPIEAVSSMNVTLPLSAAHLGSTDLNISWADSSWDLENDWHTLPLRGTTLGDRNQQVNPGMSSARFALRSTSTWSTGEYLPVGIVSSDCGEIDAANFSFLWQIEHNGAWEWEIGENDPGVRVSAYGPEYNDHQWFTMLGEHNDLIGVPVSFAVCAGDWQQAVAEMTMHRRALRHEQACLRGRERQEREGRSLVIYNDYMNTLFGDPTIDKEMPLVCGACKVGADIFCIDAGWYDSTDGRWWDSVGEWEPSITRFGSMRFAGLVHYIQTHGMQLGLWLEPEIVGINSPLAKELPDSAFFMRHGERVADQGRYHLDFRSPIARAHMSAVVDRLVRDFDVRYFKFDYNTMPGPGSDRDTESVGGALLDHCRAVLDWIDELRAKYPRITIENCASGAMRADYAMLSRLDLQSTSDQCDPLIYAAIAAGAGISILPEQQGNWGYAQDDMSDERAVLTLANGVLGRLYLSGFLEDMDEPRRRLVRQAVELHRTILASQHALVPWWPYGMPSFNGSWLAYGLRRDGTINRALGIERAADERDCDYLTIWRRFGVQSMYLPVPEGASLRQVFPDPKHPEDAPGAKPWRIEQVDSTTFRIDAATEEEASARIFEVSYSQ